MAATMLQDQFTSLGPLRVRFWQAGHTGSPVLLLHGIGCSVLEWQHNLQALAARHRVWALDLPGFGLSDKPADGPYSLPGLARCVLDFLATQGLAHTPVHLAGNSLGGRLALECAIRAPQQVASLLLVDPAGVGGRDTLLAFRLATVPGLGELATRPSAGGTRMLWRKAFADPGRFVTDELVATKLALARQPGAQAAFLKTLRSFVGLGGFRPGPLAQLHAALPEVAAPTLVLWGQADRFVPPAHAQWLQRLMPRVQVQLWPACGHAPQVECAERFNTTAAAFWGGLPG